MKLFGYSAAVAGALALAAGAAQAQPAGDAVKGKALFNQQCALCHSATAGVEGAAPSLHDVFGRKAAGEAKYPGYSKALKASAVVWTAPNLDAFLANPGKLVPGTAMPINIPGATDRQNVIAYLASLKASN